MRPVLLTAVVALVLAAGQAFAASTPAPDRLRVTVYPQGAPGPSTTWMLQCRPAGGSHPLRGRACQTLGRLAEPFRPVPANVMCTQIYGGPQEALITGTFRGKRVWARFNLRDGCQIARWERLRPLLPAAGS